MTAPRINIHQAVNTALLAIIVVLFSLNYYSNVRRDDELKVFSKELEHITTSQDYDEITIKSHETRINIMETNKIDELKNWTEKNYVRRAQNN
jgi:hypothetical protein